MTLKLTQVIALEKAAKATANSSLTTTYHTLQQTALFAGQERVYQPKDEDGDQFPPEPVKLRMHADAVLRDVMPALKRWWDLTLTKDAGNQEATADLMVDGVVLAPRLPVTFLLFLEKQLTDLYTVVSKLPVLDQAEDWDLTDGVYRTEPMVTTKSKKMAKTIVKAEATDRHPAQVDVFTEDTVIGHWRTTKLSGALPQTRQRELLNKIETLRAAVKVAREAANLAEAPEQNVADAIFSYLTW